MRRYAAARRPLRPSERAQLAHACATPRGGGVAHRRLVPGADRRPAGLRRRSTPVSPPRCSAAGSPSPCSASSTIAGRCPRAGASSATCSAAAWVLGWLGAAAAGAAVRRRRRPRRRRDAALGALSRLVDQPLQLHGRHRRHRQPRGDHRRAGRRRWSGGWPSRTADWTVADRLRRLRRRIPGLELAAGAHLHGRRRQRLPRLHRGDRWRCGAATARPALLELVHPRRLLHGRRDRRRWCAACGAASASTKRIAAMPTSTRRAATARTRPSRSPSW